MAGLKTAAAFKPVGSTSAVKSPSWQRSNQAGIQKKKKKLTYGFSLKLWKCGLACTIDFPSENHSQPCKAWKNYKESHWLLCSSECLAVILCASYSCPVLVLEKYRAQGQNTKNGAVTSLAPSTSDSVRKAQFSVRILKSPTSLTLGLLIHKMQEVYTTYCFSNISSLYGYIAEVAQLGVRR